MLAKRENLSVKGKGAGRPIILFFTGRWRMRREWGSSPALLMFKNTYDSTRPPRTDLSAEETFAVGAIEVEKSRVCFKIVPVRVQNASNGKDVCTYPFLDNGSDTSLSVDSMAKELDLECIPERYPVGTVNGKERVSGFIYKYKTNIKIESVDRSLN